MKIGVITYHRAENFGAVMQAYSLLMYLRKTGHDAELIDYRCQSIEMRYDIWNPRILLSRKNIFISLKEYICRFKSFQARKTRKEKFAEFRRLLPISKPFNPEDCINGYDAVVVGSDQVWNFHMNSGSENVFLLDLKFPSNVLKIAYAASSESGGFQKISKSYLSKCLESFDRISVRESFIKKELMDFLPTDLSLNVCVDPVFLHDGYVYKKLCIRNAVSKPYVLIFHMTYSSEMKEIAKQEAERKNLMLIEIYGGFNHRDTSTTITSWGPREILTYISNAETVYTTSFHGLALSLILERNVWVYDIGSNSRQKNLLAIAGINERLLKSKGDYQDNEIDFSTVKSRMSHFIDKSKCFLNFSK